MLKKNSTQNDNNKTNKQTPVLALEIKGVYSGTKFE